MKTLSMLFLTIAGLATAGMMGVGVVLGLQLLALPAGVIGIVAAVAVAPVLLVRLFRVHAQPV